MKKITCLLAALLLTCSLSWAQTIDVLNHDVIGVNGTTYSSWSGITSNSDAVYAGNTAGGNDAIQMRSNNNNSGIVTTASGGMVTNITVTWNSNTSDGRTLNVYGKNAAYSAATDLYGNYAGTLIGTIVKGTSTELVIDDEYAFIGVRSNNGALWLDEIQITWEDGSGVTPPSIEANNVEIAYDATEGAIAYTINNPADNGELTATTTAEWLTIGEIGETVPFTCTVNEDGAAREGVITLVYTYGEQAINQNVTVTQAGNPDALDNISDITATGAYAVQGTIVAKSQRGFIVGDGTGYVYYYNQNYVQGDYNIGDMVKLAGSVVVYGGVFEFNSSTTVTPANSSNYEAEDPTVITGEEMDARVASTTPAQLSNYVQYEGILSVNNTHYNITNIEGATTAQGSISYPLDTEFAALNGKHVKVSGYFVGISSSTYYNTMIGSVEEVVATEPSIAVTPATVEVDAEEHEGTLALTYENLEISDMTDFGIQYYDAEGEEASEPDWIEVLVAEQDPEVGEGYVVSYYMLENEGEARTAYFKVFAAGDDDFVYSNLVTINQAEYVAPVLDYAELPFEFNGGKADIETTDGLTQEGLGGDYSSAPKLKFDNTGDWLLLHFIEAPGQLSFDIKGNTFSDGTFTVQTSEDGETYTDLATYTELGATEHEVIDNVPEEARYIKWIYTEKVSGNVALGNIMLYELGGGPAPEPSITVAPASMDLDAEENYLYDESAFTITYQSIEVTNYGSFTLHYYDAEGEEIQLGDDQWFVLGVTGNNDAGYKVTAYITANEGEARTAYFKVSAQDADDNTVYSNLVTINQAAPEIPFEGATYTLVNYIESGRHYIISNGTDRAMGGQNNNNRAAVEIAVEDGVAQVDNENVVEFVINGPDVDGFYTIYDAAYPGYLYAAGASNSNYLRTQTFCDNKGQWTITFDEETNAATIVANFEGRNKMRYNSNNDIFSCYAGGQQDIYLFVKDEDETYEFFVDIKGYTAGANDTWYAISTPVNTDPVDVNHMLDETFDLYMFDPTAVGEEWQNYKVNNFSLTPGEGYLYANENNVTLKFAGAAEDLYDGTGDVDLMYYDDEEESLCWNLVGNPLSYAAYLVSDEFDVQDFFIMNGDGAEFELAERDMVNPFEAVFVKADYDGDFVYFYNDDINNGSGNSGGNVGDEKLNVRVSDENGKGDFARVRFGEGNNLEKFMLNPANTKLYFPMDDEDCAVVYADNMGEMPLNFSAAADGTYTLSINAENMEMEYLHLIDNMTGMDIDLLETPDYSFNARVNDNANRFKLVFASLTGMDENTADQFAFFSNGSFIVSNEGNAMLQVVDVTGRIVKNESINGTANVHVDAAPGVYMLRLVNGDNVKVQKVVVK